MAARTITITIVSENARPAEIRGNAHCVDMDTLSCSCGHTGRTRQEMAGHLAEGLSGRARHAALTGLRVG